ncbi:hypothetical protein J2T15_001890 [Paenibacillus harenae]|uniref:Uncharacterized protein n=2 Tax=Paenibacillus harenae TaxID=306543 RepID=A0ABT9TYK8_PAEHA|nr:hypothetical protein [Paenibacillus harenae]
MGYINRGFIFAKSNLDSSYLKYKQIHFANLKNNFVLIPLTDDLYDEINDNKGKHEHGFHFLTDKLIDFGIEISKREKSKVAYVEADYFGGTGSQQAVVWIDDNEILRTSNDRAINQALSLLGIQRDRDKDEFETIELNKYRTVEDWIDS